MERRAFSWNRLVPLFDPVQRGGTGPHSKVRSISGMSGKKALMKPTDPEPVSADPFRSAFEHSMDGLLVADCDTGVILEANSAAGGLLGYGPSELAGLPFVSLFPDLPSPSKTAPPEVFDGVFSIEFRKKRGNSARLDLKLSILPWREGCGILISLRDATERIAAESERERLIAELEAALENVKTLRGLLPICAHCKKIRDDRGYWRQVESYIEERSLAEFSHGICPECAKKHFGFEKTDD
jgi:PAS domain S-box-containing protein